MSQGTTNFQKTGTTSAQEHAHQHLRSAPKKVEPDTPKLANILASYSQVENHRVIVLPRAFLRATGYSQDGESFPTSIPTTIGRPL